MSTRILQPRGSVIGSGAARGVVVLALAAGAVVGLVAGARGAVDVGDADLVRLLRAMAGLKLVFVAAGAAAILWRLQRPIGAARLAGYALACGATAAGPGLIWFMAHVGLASVLLHGGVAAILLLLWRDKTVGMLLEDAIARRRLGLLRR